MLVCVTTHVKYNFESLNKNKINTNIFLYLKQNRKTENNTGRLMEHA